MSLLNPRTSPNEYSLKMCNVKSNKSQVCIITIYIICKILRAFSLVLSYYLLEDRRIDDIIIVNFVSLLYKTNRFHVAVRLFSIDHRRRQNVVRTSVTHSPNGLCQFVFLRHFKVFCDLLLNRRMATWNLFVKCHIRHTSENITAMQWPTLQSLKPNDKRTCLAWLVNGFVCLNEDSTLGYFNGDELTSEPERHVFHHVVLHTRKASLWCLASHQHSDLSVST